MSFQTEIKIKIAFSLLQSQIFTWNKYYGKIFSDYILVPPNENRPDPETRNTSEVMIHMFVMDDW